MVLFHKECQVNGERLEAYVEDKKLLFRAIGVAKVVRNRAYDFDIAEFKHPLINGFSSHLRTCLGGSVMDASLEEILHWAW